MNEPDFYAALGVAADAEPEQIRAAYRRSARQHHPDRGGSAEKFHEIQTAWEVLGDPQERADYDARRRHHWSANSAGSASGGSAAQSRSAGAGQHSASSTTEGAGFTYTPAATSRRGRHSAQSEGSASGPARSPSADREVEYLPQLGQSAPLSLTLTSQRVHGGWGSGGLFGAGRLSRRRAHTTQLIQKHVLEHLPASRLFNDVVLSPAETGRRGETRLPRRAQRAEHVLLSGHTLIVIGVLEIPAQAAAWDGRYLRAAGRSVEVPDCATQARALRGLLQRHLAEEFGRELSLSTGHQLIVLDSSGDLFSPVVETHGSAAATEAPRPAGRALGRVSQLAAADDQAHLVDRYLMSALRDQLANPEDL